MMFHRALPVLSFFLIATACGSVEEKAADGGADQNDAGGGLPSLSASAPAVTEGDTLGAVATFEVTLSEASDAEVKVDFSTADDSATAGEDYESASGTLTLPAGETTATVEVQVLGDFTSEADESFRLVLESPSGADLETPEAAATIEDDDRGFDFNGDGFADLLVGDRGAGDAGEAYVFFGGAEHEPGGQAELVSAGSADVVLEGSLDGFGKVISSGDVNGDGFDDAVVGDSALQNQETVTEVYVFFGSSSPGGTLRAGEADVTVSGAGVNVELLDVDGDGADDLLIGSSGLGHLFSGAALEEEMAAEDATATFVAASEFNALSAYGAGDVDGDGAEDFLWATTDVTDSGRAFLFRGGSSRSGQIGLAAAAAELQVNDGSTLAGGGDFDMNGDGFADVLVGSPNHNTSDGSVQVFFGQAELDENPAAAVNILGELDSEGFGTTVAGAGDFDGDGFGDVATGAPSADAGNAINGGIGFVYLGAENPPSMPSMFDDNLRVHAEGGGDGLSEHLAVLDFNGDGFHDLALAASGAGTDSNGKVYLFLGFAGGFQAENPVSAGAADVIFSADATSSSFGSALEQ